MRSVIFSGLAVVVVGSSLGLGVYFAKSFDKHLAQKKAQPAPQQQSLSRNELSEHLNNAVKALNYEYSEREIYFYGLELPCVRNAYPRLARSELEVTLGHFPSDSQEQRVRAVYERLPDEQCVSHPFEREQKELRDIRDSLK